jgi:hypothetical protein
MFMLPSSGVWLFLDYSWVFSDHISPRIEERWQAAYVEGYPEKK